MKDKEKVGSTSSRVGDSLHVIYRVNPCLLFSVTQSSFVVRYLKSVWSIAKYNTVITCIACRIRVVHVHPVLYQGLQHADVAV